MVRGRVLRWVIFGAAVLGGIAVIARAIRSTQEATAREECRRNLATIALCVTNWSNARGHYLPAAIPNEKLMPGQRLSWIVETLKYVEGGGPWLIDETSGWNEGSNRVIKRQEKGGQGFTFVEGQSLGRCFHCPNHKAAFDLQGHELTSYVGIAGVGIDAAELPAQHPRAGLFGYDRLTPIDAITDGAANTMAVTETTESNGPWKAGGTPTVRGLDPNRQPYIGTGRQFGGTHRGGAMVAFADGSIRFIRDTIDPRVFEALSTIAGGERLPADWEREAALATPRAAVAR